MKDVLLYGVRYLIRSVSLNLCPVLVEPWAGYCFVWCWKILCVDTSICAVVVAECCSISKTEHRGRDEPSVAVTVITKE